MVRGVGDHGPPATHHAAPPSCNGSPVSTRSTTTSTPPSATRCPAIPISPSGSSQSSCSRGGSEAVVRRSTSRSTPRSAAAGTAPSPGQRTGPGLERTGGAEPGPAPGGSTTDPRAELALAEWHTGREALAIDEANGDAEATAYDCLLLLSTLTRQTSMGESPTPPPTAASLYARGHELFDRLGDDFGSGLIRITDAMLAIAEGDLARADARVEAASPFVDRRGERFSTSRLEYVRGMLEAFAGMPRTAYGHIEHSLRLADELGIHHTVTAQARLLVHLAERSGEDGLAAQWRSFVEGRGAGWTHYDASVMASAYTRVGMRARAHRQLARAESAHRAALDWYRAAGLSEGVALVRVEPRVPRPRPPRRSQR